MNRRVQIKGTKTNPRRRRDPTKQPQRKRQQPTDSFSITMHAVADWQIEHQWMEVESNKQMSSHSVVSIGIPLAHSKYVQIAFHTCRNKYSVYLLFKLYIHK